LLSLGTIATAPLLTRVLTLFSIGIGMTFGVYGLVALIVKIDDFGLYLIRENKSPSIGKLILKAAPLLMKTLGVAGTVAMFLVGGGIIKHGIDNLLHSHLAYNELIIMLLNALTGIFSGGIIFGIVELIKKFKK